MDFSIKKIKKENRALRATCDYISKIDNLNAPIPNIIAGSTLHLLSS